MKSSSSFLEQRKVLEMPPVRPFNPHVIDNLHPARCYVDWDPAANRLDGWILHPDRPLEAVRVYANGDHVGPAPVEDCPDTAAQYPHIPHAAQSGFQLDVCNRGMKLDSVDRVTVIGFQGDIPIARRDTILFDDAISPPFPMPPPDLIEKTQGGDDAGLYRRLGFRYFQQLRDAIARHYEFGSVRRVMDFGCGSGRVLANFLATSEQVNVTGCDIDSDAVGWCRTNLAGGEFRQIGPFPPLPFASGAFDVLISLAVFAAFGPEEQRAWLPELRRVVAPGGLLLISVQGMFSASFLHPRPLLEELQSRGIIEENRYQELSRELNLRPYLGVYQTRKYTWREWSRYFEVLEHLEGEINADQDLVVMRRRG